MFFLMMLIDSEEDRSKFEIIYETYHRLMFFLAKQILPDDRDAEDAVQEAFIKIIRNLEKISDPKCPKTKHFIVIIVKRTAIDIRKKQEREPKMVTMDEEAVDSVADESPDIEAIDERLDLSETFRVTRLETSSRHYYAHYADGNGHDFSLELTFVDSSSTGFISIDTEDSELKEVYINENEAVMNTKDEERQLIWSVNNVLCLLAGNIEESEMLRIAEEVEIVFED